MPKVIVYSIPTCKFCQNAKKLLDELSVTYDDVDVSTNRVAQNEMIEKSGQVGVPVIVIDGDVIVGYDRAKLKKQFEK